jgi:hypothetical protein
MGTQKSLLSPPKDSPMTENKALNWVLVFWYFEPSHSSHPFMSRLMTEEALSLPAYNMIVPTGICPTIIESPFVRLKK